MAIERLSHASSLPRDNEGVILMYAGTFAPVHPGHADVMSAAATALIDRGEAIDMAIFVPKHDASLHSKLGDDAKTWDFNNRIDAFAGHESPLGDTVPTYVDDITGRVTYEGTIGDEALSTVSRLGMAAARGVLVMGSDRGDTAKTLISTNRIVCVRRPNYEDAIDKSAAKHPWLQEAIRDGRYIITNQQDPSLVISSTAIRAGAENGWGR